MIGPGLSAPPLAADAGRLLFALPIAAAICFVYTASRYEDPRVILRRGAGMLAKTLGFLVAAFVLLYFLSRDL